MFTCYTENTNNDNNNVGRAVKNHDDPPLAPFPLQPASCSRVVKFVLEHPTVSD
jgi:hypothetical protein